MTRRPALYVQDIWESILAIEEYAGAFTEEEFYANRQVQDAVIRRLEIIGEAVKNIDEGIIYIEVFGYSIKSVCLLDVFYAVKGKDPGILLQMAESNRREC